MKAILWINLEMGCIPKNTMHEFLVHVLLYIGVFSFLYIFWLGVLCEQFFMLIVLLLTVQMSITPYVGFLDGASRST